MPWSSSSLARISNSLPHHGGEPDNKGKINIVVGEFTPSQWRPSDEPGSLRQQPLMTSQCVMVSACSFPGSRQGEVENLPIRSSPSGNQRLARRSFKCSVFLASTWLKRAARWRYSLERVATKKCRQGGDIFNSYGKKKQGLAVR